MKKKYILNLLLSLLLSVCAYAKKIQVSVSEQDAKIYADGALIGNGRVEITVFSGECVNIRVEKIGYITVEKNYCIKKGIPYPPSSDFIKLEIDESYTSSISLIDIANNDIEIKAGKDEKVSWKTLSQIVMSYFDVIEVTDRETGYIRTSWVGKGFESGVVRTRVIVKLSSTEPLTYKVKLVSEFCNNPKANVKMDECFQEWARILRKYEGLIPELQTRLAKY